MNRILTFCFLLVCLFSGCSVHNKLHTPDKELIQTIDQNFTDASSQYKAMMKRLPADRFPKTWYADNDKFQLAYSTDWCSGFYPGTLLYIYEQTKEPVLLAEAERILQVLEKEKNNKTTHDLGFMMYCSFGNAERLSPKPAYREIMLTSAASLASRYNKTVGCIQSWDRVKSWDGKTVWTFPVIIDNMMNLELLFYAAKISGNREYRDIAVSHALTTMKNHVRPDYSSYHVVNYDKETGTVKSRETHQGFSDNSTWSRGQAWGVYGFTMVYRETGDPRFLKTAEGMADYFLEHLPADTIPYWDFNINQPGYIPNWKYDPARFPFIPRDASAAAVVASALIELAGYTDKERARKYIKAAGSLLDALSSDRYKAAVGDNGNFILKHCTGGAPSYAEIDVPLTYGDYYFVEAMKRYKELQK